MICFGVGLIHNVLGPYVYKHMFFSSEEISYIISLIISSPCSLFSMVLFSVGYWTTQINSLFPHLFCSYIFPSFLLVIHPSTHIVQSFEKASFIFQIFFEFLISIHILFPVVFKYCFTDITVFCHCEDVIFQNFAFIPSLFSLQVPFLSFLFYFYVIGFLQVFSGLQLY